MSKQRHTTTAVQNPKPPTPETGQSQLLKWPSLHDALAEAARSETQGSPPGCSPADSPDTRQRLCYNPSNPSCCPTDTPVSPADAGEQDIRQFVNQLSISISAAAELLEMPENQVRELASRTDFLMLDHGEHEAVNVLRLINWVESQTVTGRKERD